MAGFAAGVANLGIAQREIGVGGRGEMIGLIGMAFHALFGADKFCVRDLGRCEHRSVDGNAGDQQQSPSGDAPEYQRVFGFQ